MTGKRLILYLLLLLCIWIPSSAQQTNPFEIKDRLPPKSADTAVVIQQASDSLASDTIPPAIIPPIFEDTADFAGSKDSARIDSLFQALEQARFDSIASAATELDVEPDPTPPDTAAKIINGLKRLEEKLPEIQVLDNQNLLFIITVLVLLLLATLLAVNRTIINKSYRAIANDNYLRFLYREYQSMPALYHLFYAYFFINAGFFLYLTAHYYGIPHRSALLLLLICVLAVSIIYIVKHIVLNVVSISFPVDKEAHLYGFVTMLVNILLGMVLTPVNLIIAFAPNPFSQILLWIGLAAIALLYLFRQLKGLFISGRFLANYQFHFFLYLCTIEIAPLLIIGKLALGKLGIQ